MSKKYFQITNFNINKLDSDYFSVESYTPQTTITLGNQSVFYYKINFLDGGTNRNWIKLGYICEQRSANLPIFIWQEENDNAKKINLSNHGIYELSPQMINVAGQNIILNPDLNAIAIPFTLNENDNFIFNIDLFYDDGRN